MNPDAGDLEFAVTCARRAAEEINDLQANGYRTETKTDHSPVTTVDRTVNRWFIDQVVAHLPDDGVLGEEESRAGHGERTWVIDPVDGTTQMLLGVPLYMVSIALVVEGVPVVGAIANPSTGQVFWASRGAGAFRDGSRLQVSRRDGTDEPLVVGGANNGVANADTDHDGLVRIARRRDTGSGAGSVVGVSPVRYPYPSAFSGCKVAEGSWDADLFGQTAAHDVAATCVLVREAGGTVTDRYGADQRYDRPVRGCALSNGVAHAAILEAWHRSPTFDVPEERRG